MLGPVVCEWTDGALVPLPRFKTWLSDMKEGDHYRIAEVEDRSMASHNHYFAAVTQGWLNLSEIVAQEFATPEHLRKYALIKSGWHDRRSVVCSSSTVALNVAQFVRPIDEFSVVTVKEAMVTIFTAQSQKLRAMGKTDFQKSKQDVLDIVEDLLETERGSLMSSVGNTQ